MSTIDFRPHSSLDGTSWSPTDFYDSHIDSSGNQAYSSKGIIWPIMYEVCPACESSKHCITNTASVQLTGGVNPQWHFLCV